jgi:hypothetical protein
MKSLKGGVEKISVENGNGSINSGGLMTKISVEMAIYAENSANIAKTLLHK